MLNNKLLPYMEGVVFKQCLPGRLSFCLADTTASTACSSTDLLHSYLLLTVRHQITPACTVEVRRLASLRIGTQSGHPGYHFASLDFTVTICRARGSGIGLVQDNNACHALFSVPSSWIIMWDERTFFQRVAETDDGHAGECHP